MDIETYFRDRRSRRSLFRTAGVGVAGSSALFLASCGKSSEAGAGGPQLDNAQNADTKTSDAEILNSALDLEHMAVAAYTAGARHLRGSTLKVGERFRGQEQEHVDALSKTITSLKGTPHPARASYDFPRLSGQADVLRFATDIENTAVAAYIDALPKLTNPDVRAAVAAILTTQAEHIAVLRGAQGLAQAPTAFVKGKG